MKSKELLKGNIKTDNKIYQFKKSQNTTDHAGTRRIALYFQRKLLGIIPIDNYAVVIESEKYLLFNPKTHEYAIVPDSEKGTKYLENDYIIITPDLTVDMLT